MLRRSITALGLLVLATLGAAQERIRDVVYLDKDGQKLTMDVFKPAQPNGIGVIFLVSGGWNSSVAGINPLIAKPLNDKGITVFEVVHGVQPKVLVPEIIKELQHAVRFIRTNASTYGIDPKKIGISGGSSGGHLSLMVAGTGDNGNRRALDPVDRASSKVQAVGVYFPPTDFANFGKAGQAAFDIPMLGGFMPAWGVTKDTPRDQINSLVDSYSPIKFVNRRFPPTYIIHGDKDTLVPEQQSQVFIDALTKAHVPNVLVVVPGAGHDPILVVSPEASKMADWFVKTLRARH